MTAWGYLILIAAITIGLKGAGKRRNPYKTAFGIVVVAVLYAAVKQHIY